MSRVGSLVRIGLAFVYSLYTQQWQVFAAQLAAEKQRRKRDKANKRARREFNEAQRDRLEMLDVQPDAPRTLALGRVRAVEGIRRKWTSGVHNEIATLIVSFAGHEIDGFEQFYLDDTAVTLDAEGWVQEEPWGAVTTQLNELRGTLDGSGGATVTLPGTLPAGSQLLASWEVGTGEAYEAGMLSASVSLSTATLSGGRPGATYVVTLNQPLKKRRVRLRPYLGTAGQNVGAALAAEYPGKITASDRFAGMALVVMDVFYDQDTFPNGIPNLTARFRGARVFDPRTGTTVWSENPALHALAYATWPAGWALRPQDYRSADIVAAANICDQTVNYTLTATGGGTTTATLPRYRCGIVISSDADHAQSMDAIIETMAGRDGWAGGVWRVRAGAMAASVATMDESWLMRETDADGQATEDPVISAVHAFPREQRVNIVKGRCVDPAQRYQLLPYPAVRDAVLVAAKGERPDEQDYPGVNHIAHAQHLASIAIREAQAGLRLEAKVGLQAVDLELFDVLNVNLARWGFAAKPAEVVGWTWNPAGPIALRLAEISADLFTPQSPLTGRDPAPDSSLPRPWQVAALGALTVTSGTVALADGSVTTRTRVQWPAISGANVRQGGYIEVQYWPLGSPLPAGDWLSWTEQGLATETTIPALLGGRIYAFRARAVQSLPLVRGAWTPIVTHLVARRRAPTVFRQTAAPTGDVQDDDLWFDTDAGNRMYVREGGAWVEVRDSGIVDALNTAAAAQATADGKIDSFWQATPPADASEGDLWFDTDDGLRQYRWTSGAWVLASDVRIGTAISNAATAQATADGKVTTFVTASPPTAQSVGDLWLDTGNGNRLSRWSGTAWVQIPLGTAAIAPDAATEVGSAFDPGPITRSNII